MIDAIKTASFREKSLWVSVLVMTYLLYFYFTRVGADLFSGNITREETFGIFITMVVVIIVLEVIGHIILAIVSPKQTEEPKDERDRLISMKADGHSAWLMGAGVISISLFAMFRDLGAVTIVHALILMLIAVEIISDALQILYYRRGV